MVNITSAAVTAGPEASASVRHLAATSDVGVLLVSADLWLSLDERLRSDVEQLARPVVMPLTEVERTPGAAREQLLGEMFQRAIGFRIPLSGGES